MIRMEQLIINVGIFVIEDVIKYIIQYSARLKEAHATRLGKDHIVRREAVVDKNSESEDMFVESTCGCGERKFSDELESKIEELQNELANLQGQVAKTLNNLQEQVAQLRIHRDELEILAKMCSLKK